MRPAFRAAVLAALVLPMRPVHAQDGIVLFVAGSLRAAMDDVAKAHEAAGGARAGTRRFTDDTGREVLVPKRSARVFAAGPPASVAVFALASRMLLGWPGPAASRRRCSGTRSPRPTCSASRPPLMARMPFRAVRAFACPFLHAQRRRAVGPDPAAQTIADASQAVRWQRTSASGRSPPRWRSMSRSTGNSAKISSGMLRSRRVRGAKPICRFSSTVSSGKMSRPCGT